MPVRLKTGGLEYPCGRWYEGLVSGKWHDIEPEAAHTLMFPLESNPSSWLTISSIVLCTSLSPPDIRQAQCASDMAADSLLTV